MNRLYTLLMSTVMALGLAGCASPGGGNAPAGEAELRTEVKSNHDQGLGAVLGGVAGAGLGSLIGAGTGRDVAIAAGAIAGAIGGNIAQQKYFDKPQPAQQIFVRLTAGVIIEVTQPVNPALRTGQRVYVEGYGIEARVLPR
jgi:outer membrane lipoprotein SlyB